MSEQPALTEEMIGEGIIALHANLDERSDQIVKAVYHAMRSKAQKCDCRDGE